MSTSSRLSGAAQVSPLIGKIGAEFFTGDLPVRGTLDVGAAFGWDLSDAGFPLADNRSRNADIEGQFGGATQLVKIFC